VAAPLLAGFSITLITQVIGSAEDLRLPNLALLILTGATLALLAAVQISFVARQFAVTPAELEMWWPDLNDHARWEQVRREQWGHDRLHRSWARRFHVTYRTGILLLLAAVPVVLIPAPAGAAYDLPRAPAVILAVCALVAELVWICSEWLVDWQQRRTTIPYAIDEIPGPQAGAGQGRLTERELRRLDAGQRAQTVAGFPALTRRRAAGLLRVAAAIAPPLRPVRPPIENVEPPAVTADIGKARELARLGQTT
jgi:hypothetical protein